MFTQIIFGTMVVFFVILIIESIKIPRDATAQRIMFLGQFYAGIENIPGKKFDKTTWNLVDLTPGEKKPLNIHFFLWPFYTTYRYPFAYTKFKKLGAINKDDIIAWKDDETGDCIVVRKGVSNHVKFRAEYPSVTSKLDTKELATVNIITTHVLELVNIIDIFKIDSWFVATMSKIDATLKGLVSKKKLLLLNRFSSEDKGKFSNTMFGVNTDEIDPTTGEVIPGLINYGIKLFQSTFRDFEPADDATKELMKSHLNVSVFEAQGKANFAKQKGDSEAYKLKTDIEIVQEKKRRIQTGVAKADGAGNIIELVPEADTAIVAENIGKLANVTGTLVLGEGTTQMLNITKK